MRLVINRMERTASSFPGMMWSTLLGSQSESTMAKISTPMRWASAMQMSSRPMSITNMALGTSVMSRTPVKYFSKRFRVSRSFTPSFLGKSRK